MKRLSCLALALVLLLTCAFADGTWKCDRCGNENAVAFSFCPFCGTAKASVRTCPSCSYELTSAMAGFAFCPKCKAKLSVTKEKTQIESEKYERATAYKEKGYFVGAIVIFKSLGNYADSQEQLAACEYAAAKALMDSGEYEQAIDAFAAMNGYSDSTDQIAACETAIKDRAYASAQSLEQDGKLNEAIDAYEALDGYSDSKERITAIRSIREAQFLKAKAYREANDYANAINVYTEMQGYGTSTQEIENCYSTVVAKPGDNNAFVAELLKTGKSMGLLKIKITEDESEYKATYEGPLINMKKTLGMEATGTFTFREYDQLLRTIYPGKSGEDVRDVFITLKTLGYLKTEQISETYEIKHAAAVKQAEKAMKVKVDGFLTPDEVAAIETRRVEVIAARESFSQVGNVVKYGHYEQDNNKANGKEPIEWIVLSSDAETGQSLLISKYGLDAKNYHNRMTYPTWGKSRIRTWLNGSFLHAAFTAEEQKGIVTTRINTPSHNGDSGGVDTQDKIWLLSREDATTYFKSDSERQAVPTAYAVAQGAYQYIAAEGSSLLDGQGCCRWWLRSPSDDDSCPSCVTYVGDVQCYSSYCPRIAPPIAVRPALILNLDSAVFY